MNKKVPFVLHPHYINLGCIINGGCLLIFQVSSHPPSPYYDLIETPLIIFSKLISY